MSKRFERQVKKVIKKSPVWAVVLAVIILIVAVGGYYVYKNYFINSTVDQSEANKGNSGNTGNSENDKKISFHFLTLGNGNSGDCIYIKAGDNDILIDAGSRANSVSTITSYINNYITDNTIEYVIVTHADQDHIAGFSADEGIFYYYDCKTIIDFPKTNKTTKVYNNYVKNRQSEIDGGAVHYTALECYNNTNGANRTYQLGNGISMEVLYNYYYDHYTSDENNYSVCLLFRHGNRQFLLTGDLEESGEEKLAYNYGDTFSNVQLFKAGHHGSYTASSQSLLNKVLPKICVVSCVAGNCEYTNNAKHTFPAQEFIDRISVFTDKVYITSLGSANDNSYREDFNGNIIVSSGDNVSVSCSNNNTVLKDTTWFSENRQCPLSWIN